MYTEYNEKTYGRNAAQIEYLHNIGEFDDAEYERELCEERNRFRRYCEESTCSEEDAEKLYAFCLAYYSE